MYLKYLLFLLIISVPEILFAQGNTSKQIEKANKAIEIKDYAKAEKIYKNLVDKDKYNADFQLGLAELYFLTNNINKACECAYFAMRIENNKAENLFNTNCNAFKGKIKFLKDVDTPPMFLYENEYQNLIENNEVNPNYLKLIKSELRRHSYIYLYNFDRVKIYPKVGDKGQFTGKIRGLESRNNNGKEMMEVRSFFENIIFNIIKYKPAISENKPVEIFEEFYVKM